MKQIKICPVDGCNKSIHISHFCSMHRERLRTTGRLTLITVKERLLNSVKVSNKTKCWEWQNKSLVKGYGQLSINNKKTLAHRASYEEFVSKIPYGLWVLHRCDNRLCINPTHLFLGTHEDNVKDMLDKKRQNNRWGEKASRAKLTLKQVLYIKKQNKSKGINIKLAKKFNVSTVTISSIRSGYSWKGIKE